MIKDKIIILGAENILYSSWAEKVGIPYEYVTGYDINWFPPAGCGLLVTTEHYKSPEISILRSAAEHGIPTLVLSDGILEYRNTWEHPGLPPGSIFQPVMGHKIAVLGHSQARILESWGNLGKCEVVGSPRMDSLMGRKPRTRKEGEPFRFLIMTARTPGFTPEQSALAKRSLQDLKFWFSVNKKVNGTLIEPVWRITKGIDKEIGVENTLTDISGKELSEQLSEVDAVITTPSTSMLEAMLIGLPVAILDYTNSPHYAQAAWSITAPLQIESVLPELMKPAGPKMLFQNTVLHEELECRTPAVPRLARLVEEMLHIGGESRQHNKPLRFPDRILLNEDGGHHMPEESFDLAKLYPDHPIFSDMDRAKLQVEIGHLKDLISRLEDRLKQKDAQLAEKSRQIAEKDGQIAEKDGQIAEKDGQIAEKDRQIEAFLNSYSWRVTAPLRYLHGNASPNINRLINIIKPRKLEEGQQGFEAYQVKILNPVLANRPRIVHTLANFMTGGSSRLVVDLIENLGHLYEQEVITSHSPSPPCYKGLILHELKSSKKIADYLLKFRPELVHVHYWGELDKEWYDKIFIAASDYGCKIIENINTPVEPYVADSINSYVYVSDYVRKHYGKDDGKNITIYPGSNFNIFDRHGDIADIPDNCIGMVYRLEPDKLNIQSIDVFIKVAQRRPEIKVLIVGGGLFLETYRIAAIAGGVINSFTFTGYVSYEELPKLYEEMSIFVAPVWKESFGQVSPFAMNMGIPVVGYDIGALSEIIEDKTLLAPPGDSDRLAEIIIDLLGNREKRLLIGRRNRDRTQAFFSDEVMVKKYEKLYEKLIKGQS